MTTNFNHLKNARSGKALWVAIVIIAASCAFMLLPKPQTATAADKANWSAGNIISDSNFTDKNSMSVQDIQAFLDQKIGTCDVWGKAKATEYGSNLTRAEYAASRGWNAPPYTCLNMYHEVPKTSPTGGTPANNYSNPNSIPSGAQSAAWIIKDAANRYNISPKVLLVKIATESLGPLTSDTWPLFSQYRYAMGSHCPDSGPNGSANCDTNYAGFSIQMYSAAELMRWYLDSMDQSWWSYKKPHQTNRILWNIEPSGCGAGDVYIQNKATAALYTYTPYQPNQAALNNLYGTGDNCSAYGNRNVWRVYTDWFGPATGYGVVPELKSRYDILGGENGALGLAMDGGFCNGDRSKCWQKFTNGFITYSKETGAWESKGAIRARWAQLGYQNGTLGFPTGPEVWNETSSSWSQAYQNGTILGTGKTGYWMSKGAIRNKWVQMGAENSSLGMPIDNEHTDGIAWWQQFENGFIIGTGRTGYWESKGAIRARWAQLGYQNGTLGFPTGPEVWNETSSSWSQAYQNGTILGTGKTGYWMSKGAIRNKWVQMGAENSSLGMPIDNEHTDGIAWWQQFENGFIIGTGRTGYWESKNGIRKYWATIGYQSGPAGYPSGPENYDADTKTWSQKYQKGTIYFSESHGGSFAKN